MAVTMSPTDAPTAAIAHSHMLTDTDVATATVNVSDTKRPHQAVGYGDHNIADWPMHTDIEHSQNQTDADVATATADVSHTKDIIEKLDMTPHCCLPIVALVTDTADVSLVY